MTPLRIAITADLHWGVRPAGDECTLRLVEFLRDAPPDLLLVAGDIGAGEDFEHCLLRLEPIACRKAVIPGNHDVWVRDDDDRGDSWDVYSKFLPDLCTRHGVHYLDQEALVLPDSNLAVIGSMNWYDYTWADDPTFPRPVDWDDRVARKLFTRGRHNDGRFVRWPYTDISFTEHAVATFRQQLDDALSQVETALIITHHPAIEALNFPEQGPMTLDRMLWRAFSGNRRLEEVLRERAPRLAGIFSGHTHRAREARFGNGPAHNIGGDYDWKRLLLFSYPAGSVEVREFRAV